MPKYLLPAILCVFLLTGCTEKEQLRHLFLFGFESSPNFNDIAVGSEIKFGNGNIISVFGYGDLGRSEWGTLNIDWGDGKTSKFTSGGVMSWQPAQSKNFETSGEAHVPLLAYLIVCKTDKKMNPITYTVKYKWRIDRGNFHIPNVQE